MPAGNRRTLLSFQTDAGGTASGMGGKDQNWTESFTEWGAIQDASAFERLAGSAQEADVRVVIELPFRPDVTAAMRCVDAANGVAYNIRGVRDPDHRRQRLLLDCEAGVAM